MSEKDKLEVVKGEEQFAPMRLKRYWLFVYPMFYPEGGMKDWKGAFDSIDEAANYPCIGEIMDERGGADMIKVHVLDTETMVITDLRIEEEEDAQ